MELWFRRMTLADVGQVMKIEREVYEFPWTERIFRDCIRVGYQCWMALRQQTVVGHAVISVTAGESHILNLSIGKAYQRQGIGRHFIEFLVDEARARDAETNG